MVFLFPEENPQAEDAQFSPKIQLKQSQLCFVVYPCLLPILLYAHGVSFHLSVSELTNVDSI